MHVGRAQYLKSHLLYKRFHKYYLMRFLIQASLASQVQQVTINPTITEEDRRRAWEQGRPDVGNTDSFAAIQRHMEEQIGGGQS